MKTDIVMETLRKIDDLNKDDNVFANMEILTDMREYCEQLYRLLSIHDRLQHEEFKFPNSSSTEELRKARGEMTQILSHGCWFNHIYYALQYLQGFHDASTDEMKQFKAMKSYFENKE